MDQQNQENNQTIPVMTTNPSVVDTNLYVPSSIEKKRALIMYFMFGIMIVIADKKTNDFEYFHLKQAIGWRISFMVFLIISLLVLMLPLIKFIGILFFIVWMVLFVMMAKQAWDGKYHPNLKGYSLALFPSLGNWLLALFEIKFEDGQLNGGSPMPPQNTPNT